jgi:hypothetical protein
MTIPEVTASAETLMHQAVATADVYLMGARDAIDHHFGKGYAVNHPELIAAFMRAAASDYRSAMILAVGQNIERALDAIAQSLEAPIQFDPADLRPGETEEDLTEDIDELFANTASEKPQ